jgi:hypothetical protein
MTLSDHLKAANILLWFAVIAIVVAVWTFRENLVVWLRSADEPSPVLSYMK